MGPAMKLKFSFPFAASIAIIVIHAAVVAQDPTTTSSPKASIDDLSWVAGHWEGEAMGGKFEETWNPPKAGAMMGMFKFVKDGEIDFYEILTIVPSGESLVLRLKHFDNQLVGWEEKDKSVEFPLASISETEAKFDGLTFSRINADEMHIVVMTMNAKTGQTQELRFECQRVGKAASNSQQQAITQVLALDSVLSQQRDHLPEKHSLATAIQAYVYGLESIDFDRCPPEFAQAFKKHRDAWSETISFFQKHDNLRGEMHAVIEQIRKTDQNIASQLDQCMLPVMNSWKDVELAARKHGVK